MADRFSFYKSYYDAALMLPEEQRGEFLMGIASYAFEGVEPAFDGMCAMAFILIKPNIDASVRASENGKGGGRPPKKKNGKADKKPSGKDSEKPPLKPPLKPNEKTNSKTHAETDKEIDRELDMDIELEKETEIEHSDPFEYAESAQAGFPWECLAAFNEAIGTTFSSMPAKCTRTLERFEAKYGLDAVKRMCEFKRDEWRGTNMERHLTPNTLFSPDHFEQYMQQSQKKGGNDADNAYYGAW